MFEELSFWCRKV